MEVLLVPAYLLMMLFVYAVPAVLGGFPIFIVVTFIAFLIGRSKAVNDPARRQRILNGGMIIGGFFGMVLGFYIYMYGMIFFHDRTNPRSPQEIISSQYYDESVRDGRKLFWNKGTVASLLQWIDQNGQDSKRDLRKRLYAEIQRRITGGLLFSPDFSLDVDANDLLAMEQLALEFDASERSDFHLPLTNFADFKKNGFRQFPAAVMSVNDSANTYLMIVVTACAKEPLKAECQQYMTRDNISALELRYDDSDEAASKYWEQKLDNLRRANGIKNRINPCDMQWCVDRHKEYMCNKSKSPAPELECPPPRSRDVQAKTFSPIDTRQQAGLPAGTKRFFSKPLSLDHINVTGAPDDTDFDRSSMMSEGSTFRLYFFKKGTNDTLYQFAWDGSSYKYGHNSVPELSIEGKPDDANPESFAITRGGNYYLYMMSYDKTKIYKFTWSRGSYVYNSTADSILPIADDNAGADRSRWAILYDGKLRLFFGERGNKHLLRFTWNGSSFEYQNDQEHNFPITKAPADSDTRHFNMLTDGVGYYQLFYLAQENNPLDGKSAK